MPEAARLCGGTRPSVPIDISVEPCCPGEINLDILEHRIFRRSVEIRKRPESRLVMAD